MTKRLDSATRQRQIIDASLELIKRGGIQKLTIKNIAADIGISEQAIYRHFDSKLDILTAIIRSFDQNFKDSFKQFEMPENSIDQIQALIKAHIEYFDRQPATAAVIFSEGIFQNEALLVREVHEALQKRIDHMTKTIEKGQQTGEIKDDCRAEHLAYVFLGTLRLLVTLWRLSSFSFSLPERGALIVEDMINLIKK